MEEERKPPRWGLWVAVWLALLAAYPLSMGPINSLKRAGYVSEDAFKVYHPVKRFVLATAKYTLGPYLWYLDLWP